MAVFWKKSTLTACLVLMGLLFIGGVFAYKGIFGSQEFIVTRTVSGFVPPQLLLRKGDSVRFISETGESFWPASDSHPTHGFYEEFDPTRALEPDESWTFIFDIAGVWQYHDHLAPDAVGTILVVGKPGESVQSCLKDSGRRAKEATCWTAEITAALDEGGLESAFSTFVSLYEKDSLFPQNCHDVAHILGKAAYSEFSHDSTVVIRRETSYCSYGFYHGFIEQMFAEKGVTHFEDAERYCDMLRTSEALPSKSAAGLAYMACHHGIGHALFDSIDATFWGDDTRMVSHGIDTCERISKTDEERAACASGIFNSLVNAYSAEQYNLSFPSAAPTRICQIQKDAYKKPCYIEVGVRYIRREKMSFTQAVNFTQSIDSRYRSTTLSAYVQDAFQHDLSDKTVGELYDLCAELQRGQIQTDCISGAVSALTIRGAPGKEEEELFAFCGFVEGRELRNTCFKEASKKMKQLKSYEQVRVSCNTLPEPDQSSCLSVLPKT